MSGSDSATRLAPFCEAGILLKEEGRLRLTRQGMLMANEVMSRLRLDLSLRGVPVNIRPPVRQQGGVNASNDSGSRGHAATAVPSYRSPHLRPAAAPNAPATPNARVFNGGAGLILYTIKPGSTADFETVLNKTKEALVKSEKPERKQQAASWRVYKSDAAGANGNVTYVMIIDPAMKEADYNIVNILNEAFPSRDSGAVQVLHRIVRQRVDSHQSRPRRRLFEVGVDCRSEGTGQEGRGSYSALCPLPALRTQIDAGVDPLHGLVPRISLAG